MYTGIAMARLKLSAMLPAVVVAVIHFRLCLMVAPQANSVFQRWFDTGAQPECSDAAVLSIYKFLSLPVPVVLFAVHPAHAFPLSWWLVSLLDSCLWGLVIYAVYWLPSVIHSRLQNRTKRTII